MIKKPTMRRLLAYLIDVIIISIIASALSRISFINPRMEKYDALQDTYIEILSGAKNNPEVINEIFGGENSQIFAYDLAYYGMYMSICTVVVTGLYFIVFQYFTKGKTLGRKLMNIELISRDGKDVSIKQLFKRSIIINSLAVNVILIVMLIALSKNAYIKYSQYVQIVDYALVFLSIGFVIYRDDGIGLHDLFAGTRVILSSDKEKYLNSLVKEANVVSEKDTEEVVEEEKVVTKKTVKKTPKKTTKKSTKKVK